MEVTETKSEGLKRGYAATATAAEITERINAKLKEVQPTAATQRVSQRQGAAGGAEEAVCAKRLGRNDAGDVDEVLKTHLDENSHRPAQRPDIKIVNETFNEGDDLNIEFSYELLPDIPEVGFGDIKLERMSVEVQDDEVDKALKELAESATSYDDVKDGEAADGDQVVIDFVGRVDGEELKAAPPKISRSSSGRGDSFPVRRAVDRRKSRGRARPQCDVS